MGEQRDGPGEAKSGSSPLPLPSRLGSDLEQGESRATDPFSHLAEHPTA